MHSCHFETMLKTGFILGKHSFFEEEDQIIFLVDVRDTLNKQNGLHMLFNRWYTLWLAFVWNDMQPLTVFKQMNYTVCYYNMINHKGAEKRRKWVC